ncbi:N-acetylneuraminate lyase [Paenibacillus taichungensis]|uniref:N-acetylneuraminate lyase n=1 Tax=Paenibacillus taichungensis TaxID=484184 RepID=A0A329QMA0_9BACL|nr:dihydrodipicolinate synthase family protein [Paenibacillus taichungensis]RAW13495.1 N-acetylneuraminate lyase [Paenibacillus taichungensis]
MTTAFDLTKFKGVIPAFYACYEDDGQISEERTYALCDYYVQKKVHGVYVGGSSGECIYHNLDERKAVLSYVASRLKGHMTLIAHVGAPSTRDSIALAEHAASLGYDALSAIPPIYFTLPDHAVSRYWNDIMEATPLPFLIYNIPQTTGYTLRTPLYEQLLQNEKVIGIKNSSMPTFDIERFKRSGGPNSIVFNGPDEQFVAGRIMGADGGIGGTYGAMPELFLLADQYIQQGKFTEARHIQSDINEIIVALCSLDGSMYAGIKEVLRRRGVNIGGVRLPLAAITEQDAARIDDVISLLEQVESRYITSTHSS